TMSKRLQMLEKLLADGSRDPFHHYARALELRSLGRNAEALAALEGLTGSTPDYVPSYLMAAQLAQELGEPERARALASHGMEAATRAGNAHAHGELEAFRDALPEPS